MDRAMSEPKLKLVRRANSSRRATAYYKEAAQQVAPTTVAVTMATEKPVDGAPLKVGQAVQVTKAGTWIQELARVKKLNADGTVDVSVFSKFSSDIGKLKEELVLTNKPHPSEVRPAPAAVAARLEALADQPPDMFEPYKVYVVREYEGREEWGAIRVNAPGHRWQETVRIRQRSGFEMFCMDAHATRLTEPIPGAEESNQRKLLAMISQATRWKDVANADVYCGGAKLSSFHVLRIHGLMRKGLPLVVVAAGQAYDREYWAPIAEIPPSERGGCACIVS